MYHHLRGRLIETGPMSAVIECAGIGFDLRVPQSTLEVLAVGGDVLLYTYLHVRDDDLRLFGFATRDERRFFEQILAISGVGPAIALAALSALSVAELHAAIAGEDVKALTRIRGVGKRLAERLIVELRDRLPPSTRDAREDPLAAAAASVEADAVAALVALGFATKDAATRVAAALERGDGSAAVEELIRASLR